MRFNRRRSDRPDSARTRLGSSLETLEGRALLTANRLGPTSGIFAPYTPSDIPITNPITNQAVNYSVVHQLAHAGSQSSLYGNSGKVVSGVDREGDQWTITVHGPGTVIVTDISPNDGVLDDYINTIQLVGTDINSTYVTGNVVSSNRVLGSQTIPFNELVALGGVKSIALNGFDLGETVTPVAGAPNNVNTGIFLFGGVQYLTFHDIYAPINTANNDQPVDVVIGDPNTPLPVTVKPTVVINSINNTVYNTAGQFPPLLVPQTSPTVNIIVNGQLNDLSLLSAGSDLQDLLPSLGFDQNGVNAQEYNFPAVAVTGRTSVQAIGINKLSVFGGATNLTASRASQPFVNGFSGLDHLNTAVFNGQTDAVGLDVNGPIGSVTYNQGISNNSGTSTGTSAAGNPVPASSYGRPLDQTSYAGAGYVGGQVIGTSIKKVTIRPSGYVTQTPSNPAFIQLHGPGSIFLKVHPGAAATNAVIATSGSIGKVNVTGDLYNTEIKTGFHYPSYVAGLEGTRAPSKIGSYKQDGNLINSVVSATYRPYDAVYGTPLDTAGPGKITGHGTGVAIDTQALTALSQIGSGVYARTKVGRLPQSVD